MMEERYQATTQNWFYPDMSNVNKNITMEAKLISPPMYFKRSLNYEVQPRRILLNTLNNT